MKAEKDKRPGEIVKTIELSISLSAMYGLTPLFYSSFAETGIRFLTDRIHNPQITSAIPLSAKGPQ